MRLVLDLLACQTPESRHRGIGRYSLALAEAMVSEAAERHEIHLLLGASFPDAVDDLVRRFAASVPAGHVHRYTVPGPLGALEPANAWRSEVAARLRESVLADLEPDVVHVSSLFEGLVDDASVTVGRLAPLPTAVTLYDLIPLLNPGTYLEDPAYARWYRARLEDLKRADLLLAISESTRREAIEALGIPPDGVVTISTDADPRFRRVELSAAERHALAARHGLHRPFVMYTGGADPRKNLEGLVRAYGLLPAGLRAAHQLAIVCRIDAEGRRRLTDAGAAAGLGPDELVLTGFVPDDDLVRLYNLCRLFVFPSLHEGFGLPALEAMRCGAPVLGTNRSSVPEVIGLAEALFDPADPAAVASAMQRGLADEAFRERLVRNAEAQSGRFSWTETARRSLDAIEALHASRGAPHAASRPAPRARPRLAYVSPLPPETSGIADFSAELLPALGEHYDITVVTDGPPVTPRALRDRFPRATPRELAEAPGRWDRVLYQMGNSTHHAHVPELLARVPGVVVLHDVFLSHLMRELGASGRRAPFAQTLVECHGYAAAAFLATRGEEAAVWEYPCSLDLVAGASGVIVQSAHALALVRRWYGPEVADRVREIPHARDVVAGTHRDEARAALGLAAEDLLVCCFGVLGPAKLDRELLQAFLASPLAARQGCRMVFVGDGAASAYGRTLQPLAAAASGPARVTVTGRVDEATYRRHLAAADFAVQLRTRSRGETSGAILDCMAHGVPVIVNAHGASTELPAETVCRIADPVRERELADALVALADDPARRATLAGAARAYLARERSTRTVALRYRNVLESFAERDPFAGHRRLVDSVRHLPGAAEASGVELAEVARCIAENERGRPVRQLLVDVSTLVRTDAKSGIQRVVRNILSVLLRDPPDGWRVEPVYRSEGTCRYARRFALRFLGLDPARVEDDPVDASPGDVFLGLDLDMEVVGRGRDWIRRAKARGVATHFVLYDMIPVLLPGRFPADFVPQFRAWIDGLAPLSTGIVCISEAVAEEYRAWLGPAAPRPDIRSFHLGADLDAGRPGGSPRADEEGVLAALAGRPFFLMVGTLEPRKGHALVLGALERLWSADEAPGLVIVGRQGWTVESLVERLRTHPEAGRRLFWLDEASDPMLLELYRRALALVQASEAEGFGLPLVEAACHGVPVIARDLPVFREVAGQHAFWFRERTPEGLAERLMEWMRLRDRGLAPDSRGMKRLTWEESARQLLARVLPGTTPSPPARASA